MIQVIIRLNFNALGCLDQILMEGEWKPPPLPPVLQRDKKAHASAYRLNTIRLMTLHHMGRKHNSYFEFYRILVDLCDARCL